MEKKNIFKRFLNFLVISFNGMAYGLFATLIVGVIIGQIGLLFINNNFLPKLGENIDLLASLLKGLMGVGIGVGIGYSLKQKGLKLVVLAVVGGLAHHFHYLPNGNALADPMVVYLVVVAVYLIFDYLLKKETPIDIILIPIVGVIVGFGITYLIGRPIKIVMNSLGTYIQTATTYQPFLMGIVIAVLMGMFLTMPISSAAIAISIQLGGIAGGAAAVGCSVQMIGFMVMSRKDNNLGTIVSVGVGTSMLQFKNILKKPIIWLPTIIVSAVLGPISTLLFKLETNYLGSGMGTSGFVGQIATFEEMGYHLDVFLKVLSLHLLIPLLLVYFLDLIMRKKNLIVAGDLKI